MPELLAQPQLWPHGWALVLRMNLLQHRNSTACSETWCAAWPTEFVQNEGTNRMRKLYLTTENITGQGRVLIFFAFQKKAWFLSNGSTQTFWKINLGRVPQTQGRAFCQVWPQIRQVLMRENPFSCGAATVQLGRGKSPFQDQKNFWVSALGKEFIVSWADQVCWKESTSLRKASASCSKNHLETVWSKF